MLDVTKFRASFRRMKKLVCLLIFAATPGLATCPAPPDIAAAQAKIFLDAKAARTHAEGRTISPRLWELWLQAPDDTAQEMLDSGMGALRVSDFVTALDHLDRLVAYCPDYAEGYNQRAFVNYLNQNFAAVLSDLDLALERQPQHVGALSGKALTLMGLGREEEAQIVLREAVMLNPWISEASLLKIPLGEEL